MKIFKFLIVVFIVVFAFSAISTMFSGTDNLEKKEKAASEDVELTKTGAYLVAQKFILKGLKAPSTAEFATYGYGDDPATVIKIDSLNYSVNIWVDAQNSFGAMIRNRFKVDLKKDGEMWRLVDLKQFD